MNHLLVQDQCTNNTAVAASDFSQQSVRFCCENTFGLQQVCEPYKILIWTLLACERRVNIPLLTCVYLLHIVKYLQV